MINLLKNEYIKLFKRKSILVMVIIALIFSVLTNVLYKFMDNTKKDAEYDYFLSENYKSVLNSYNQNIASEFDEYIRGMAEVKKAELAKKYGINSWQYSYLLIQNYVSFENLARCEYDKKANKDMCVEVKDDYNLLLKKLDEDNWRVIVEEELNKKELELESIDDRESYDYQSLLIHVDILKIRLDNNIKYGSNNDSFLDKYESNRIAALNYINKDINKLSATDKEMYYQIKSDIAIDEYKIEHKLIHENINISTVLGSFYTEFAILLLVMVLMYSGTMVSSEYSKGTVKLLLVKPYSRTKILLSKLLVAFSMIFISYIMLYVINLLVALLVFGTKGLNEPALIYNITKDKLIVMSMFKYNFMSLICNLPIYLFLGSVAFAVSTIVGNTAVSIISGFGANIVTNMVILLGKTISWTKYTIFYNLDLSPYILGTQPLYKGGSLGMSIIIIMITLAIILIPTFIIFKRKDIKNI